MPKHRLVWLTERGARHQQMALAAAPPELEATILRRPDSTTLRAVLAGAEFLISERRGVIDQALLEASPHLRLIVRLGSLSHDIDVEAARERGIAIARQPVIGSILVAEHCLMMTLALLKRLPEARAAIHTIDSSRPAARTDEDTFGYNWAGLSGVGGLIGKTVAVLGAGEIGVELARRLRPFLPARVYYHKRVPYPASVERELGLTSAPLETCYAEADVLATLLPYSLETDGMIGAQVLAAMKPGSVLVHAGSGSTLDEQALATALRRGHLGGAALDTFEYEPLTADHPLLKLAADPTANVILTPHIAASTLPPDEVGRARDYDEVLHFLRGDPLRWPL